MKGNTFISILFVDRNMRLTRFEKSRIIGARGLQIALGAPVLMKIPDDLVDPIEIARLEFNKGLIPITVVKR